MNGAELGEGVVLHVEPAGSPDKDMTVATTTNTTAEASAAAKDNLDATTPTEDDDLDDFFDSL